MTVLQALAAFLAAVQAPHTNLNKLYQAWLRDDPGEAARFNAYLTAVKAGSPPAAPPSMASGFGKMMVAATEIAAATAGSFDTAYSLVGSAPLTGTLTFALTTGHSSVTADLLVDGGSLGRKTTAGTSFAWPVDTAKYKAGKHTLQFVLYSVAGAELYRSDLISYTFGV